MEASSSPSLTTSRPKKRVIDGKGLTPDVVVKMDRMKQMKRSTDTQLKKALEIANQKAGN